jgi:tetratricopeptide (TPR) repeat protein
MISRFKQNFIIGIILASLVSFVWTQDFSLVLILLKFLGNILLFWLLLYLDIFIHEFGHAIAGYIVKFPIPKITIGFGKNLFKYKLGKTTLVVNQGMQGGLTYPGSMSPDFLRLRYFFFTLGGVGLQIISLFLVSLIVFLIDNIFPQLFINTFWSNLVGLFFFSNILLIIGNLIPFQVNLVGIPIPNDGLVLLTIFFMKREKIQEILLSGEILEGMEYLEEKNFSKAESIFRQCSLKYPEMLLPKMNLSASLIRQNKIDECIELLSKILTELETNSKPGKDPRYFLLLNNLAWGCLIKSIKDQEPSFLNLADQYSEQAIKLNNKAPAIIGTRASILIEIGQFEAGIKLLKNQVNLNQPINEMTNNAIGFLYLAYSYYLNGNFKQAQKYWQKVQDHDDLKGSEYKVLSDHILERTNTFNWSN